MDNNQPRGAPSKSSGNVVRGNADAVTEVPHLWQHEGPGTSGLGSLGQSTSFEKKVCILLLSPINANRRSEMRRSSGGSGHREGRQRSYDCEGMREG